MPKPSEIETLTDEEVEVMAGTTLRRKALRIIYAQAAQIAELEAKLEERNIPVRVTVQTPSAQDLQKQIDTAILAAFGAEPRVAQLQAEIAELTADRDEFERAWIALALKDHEGLVITPAERAVLDAWAKVPEELLHIVHKMPIHLFKWLLVPCEAELTRRSGV